MWAICGFGDDKINIDERQTTFERLEKLFDIIRAAENLDDLTDGQDSVTGANADEIRVSNQHQIQNRHASRY